MGQPDQHHLGSCFRVRGVSQLAMTGQQNLPGPAQTRDACFGDIGQHLTLRLRLICVVCATGHKAGQMNHIQHISQQNICFCPAGVSGAVQGQRVRCVAVKTGLKHLQNQICIGLAQHIQNRLL